MNHQPDNPSWSVIVPVYNQWALVPTLLDCLAQQNIGQGYFEILLVDNGSDWFPAEQDLPVFARLLHCPTPGSYAARNTGIGRAKGKMLAFTDADCRPAPDWLEKLQDCAGNPEKAQIIAGAIQVVPTDKQAPNPYELYDMVLGLPQERYVQRGYGITANLAFPRSIIDRNGLFNPARFSGGDAEFCRRAGKSGITVIYCAQARVVHPARDDWQTLSGKVRRVKGGQLTCGSSGQRLHYALRTLLPPVRAWKIILTSDRLDSWSQRWTVFSIQCRLWLVEMHELICLLTGNKPARA